MWFKLKNGIKPKKTNKFHKLFFIASTVTVTKWNILHYHRDLLIFDSVRETEWDKAISPSTQVSEVNYAARLKIPLCNPLSFSSKSTWACLPCQQFIATFLSALTHTLVQHLCISPWGTHSMIFKTAALNVLLSPSDEHTAMSTNDHKYMKITTLGENKYWRYWQITTSS